MCEALAFGEIKLASLQFLGVAADLFFCRFTVRDICCCPNVFDEVSGFVEDRTPDYVKVLESPVMQ
jgi:hypothetical protein